MGVARYTTTAEMPEQLQRVLPDIDELRKVLSIQPTDNSKLTLWTHSFSYVKSKKKIFSRIL